MASVFDNYEIAQSRLVRPYQGSALGELRELGSEMQRRYDTAQLNMDNTEMIRRQVRTDPKSQGLLNESLQRVGSQLQGMSARPDKENLVRSSAILARDFGMEAREFMDNAQRIQQFNEEVDKNANLDGQTKDKLKNLEYALYQGMRRDPATGQLTNKFTPRFTPAKSIDSAEVVNKIIQGIQADKRGNVTRDIQGNYYVERGGSTERVTEEEVARIANNIINTDPEIQAYMRFQGQLAGAETSLNIDRLDQISNPELRDRVAEVARTRFVSPKEAVNAMAATSRARQIQEGIIEAAVGKAAFTRTESSNKIMGETEEAGRAAADMKEQFRMTFAAPASAIENELKGKTVSDLGSDIDSPTSDVNTQIQNAQAMLARTLGKDANGNYIYTQAERDAAKLNVQLANAAKAQRVAIRDKALDRAAQGLNYDNYQDYVNRGYSQFVNKEVRDRIGNQQVQLSNGTELSSDQLKQAIIQGRIHSVSAPTGSMVSTSFGMMPARGGGISDYRVTLPDGQEVTVDRRDFNKMHGLMTNVGKDPVGKELFKKANQVLKDSKDLAVGGTQTSLRKDEKETVQTQLSASPQSFKIIDLSTGKEVLDNDDLPKENLEVTGIDNSLTAGGTTTFYGRGTRTKDKDATVRNYALIPLPGSDAANAIGGRFKQEGIGLAKRDPETARRRFMAGEALTSGIWGAQLKNATTYQSFPLTNDFGTAIGSVVADPNRVNGQMTYYLIDRNGNESKRSFTNPEAAAAAIRSIIDDSNDKEAQSKPQ